MGQVTLYLDAKTETRMKAAATSAGISQSRWVAGLIRQRTANQWPQAVVELAGAWPDMPSLEEIRADEGEDAPREPL
jgi:beta-glucanase (GH16 family)